VHSSTYRRDIFPIFDDLATRARTAHRMHPQRRTLTALHDHAERRFIDSARGWTGKTHDGLSISQIANCP
jgi:hypothetical protein